MSVDARRVAYNNEETGKTKVTEVTARRALSPKQVDSANNLSSARRASAAQYSFGGRESRVHKLALWTGGLLLLLAAVLFAVTDDADSSVWSSQRLRVQQTLAGSAPCASCHTAVSETPRLALETGWASLVTHTAPSTDSNSSLDIQPSTKIVNVHATERVAALGARLLNVQAKELDAYTAVVDQFVAASDALADANTPAEHSAVLRALDVAEQHVRALEQQANPYRLAVAPDGPVTGPESAANAPSVPQPLVALVVVLATILPALHIARRDDTVIRVWRRQVVYGARRRGPPLGDCRRMSVLGKGRLRLLAVRSLFSCVSSSRSGSLVL